MSERTASCHCGQLTVTCTGDPIRVSMCHCLLCQRRTGSAFGAQARFPEDSVKPSGREKVFTRVGDTDTPVHMHFCPDCGSTVYWHSPGLPGFRAVALGAFADPAFPAPSVSVYGDRKHAWVGLDHIQEHL